jgi:hypothetical protein
MMIIDDDCIKLVPVLVPKRSELKIRIYAILREEDRPMVSFFGFGIVSIAKSVGFPKISIFILLK